jgi:hypothetical protein
MRTIVVTHGDKEVGSGNCTPCINVPAAAAAAY